jgi:hypothetical protein
MKFILSESQYRLLKEQDQNWEIWFKRRANPESLQFFIDRAIADEPNPCDDYEDKFDYAFNRIDWAVTDFLSIDEEFYNSEEFDEYHSILVDLCKEWFAEKLFDDYRNTCDEHEQDIED